MPCASRCVAQMQHRCRIKRVCYPLLGAAVLGMLAAAVMHRRRRSRGRPGKDLEQRMQEDGQITRPADAPLSQLSAQPDGADDSAAVLPSTYVTTRPPQ